MFSSNTDMWGTPIELFRQLDNEFHFNTDVCAVASNAKCSHYYSPKQNGLEQEWRGVCFMNPPYGRQIGKWVKKAYESTLRGGHNCCMSLAVTNRYKMVSRLLFKGK
jgi:phage N-6-adenine-methyltransferase